ncbi:NTP transferase domain-containing protein [Dysosmobacter sp.]
MKSKYSGMIKRLSSRSETSTMLILLVMVVIIACLQKNFFSSRTLLSYINAFTPLILLAMGQAVVIIAGGLDMSCGTAMALLLCIMTKIMNPDEPATGLLALAVGLAAAVGIGLVNGFAVGYLRLPPVIATYATSYIWLGMQAFKPLLPFGGRTVIETTVARLREGGATDIVLVTGFLADQVEQCVRGDDVRFVHNHNYARSEMFDSVKLGLAVAKDEEIFLLPADLPQFDPALLEKLKTVSAQAVHPVCCGRNGHPLLLRRSAVAAVLAHDGRRGLKGALGGLDAAVLETEDFGCLLDIDTPDDYLQLLDFRSRSIPTLGECEKLFQRFNTPQQVRAHCEAVCGMAMRLSENVRGIDRELLMTAARIHDAARKERGHAEVLAEVLTKMGYAKLASVIRVHMDLPSQMSGGLSESSLLYLADKLVLEDREVTLDQRFSRAEERFRDQPEALAAVRRKKAAAQKILAHIQEMHQTA